MVLTIFRTTMQFPKSQRHVIASRMQDNSLIFLENIILAYHSTESRNNHLHVADHALETLRIYSRLAMDLQFLSQSKYHLISRIVNECGKMIGGWLKGAGKKTGESRR